MKSVFLFFQSLRVKDWWYLNGVFVLGAVSSDRFNLTINPFFFGLVISSLYLAHGYALNEHWDRKSAPCPFSKITPGGEGALGAYLLLALNCAIAFFLLRPAFFMVVLGGVVSWLYSSPPLRLKKRFVPRLLLNSLGFSFLFLVGAVSQGPLSSADWLLLLFVFFLFIPIELIHGLNDFEDDGLNSIATFPRVFGVRKTVAMTLALFVGLQVFSLSLYAGNLVSLPFVFLNLFLVVGMSALLANIQRHGRLSCGLDGLKARSRILLSVYGGGLFLLYVIEARLFGFVAN